MNNTALWIYLLGLMDKLGAMLTFAFVASAACCLLAVLGWVAPTKPYTEAEVKLMEFSEKTLRPSFITMIVVVTVATFTPNSKTIAAMIVVPAIVENQLIQNLGDNSRKLIEGKMKAWLDEQVKKAEGSEK